MIVIQRITTSGLGCLVPLAQGPWRYPLIHPENSSRLNCGYEPVNQLADHSTVFASYRMQDFDDFSRWQENPISNRCPDVAFGIVAESNEPPLPARAFRGLMGRFVALERNLGPLLAQMDQTTPFGFRIKEFVMLPSLGGVECFALVHAYEPLLVYEGTRSGYTFPIEVGWDPREPSAHCGEDITVFTGIAGLIGKQDCVRLAGPLLPREPEKIRYLALPECYNNPHYWSDDWGMANAA